ncbi:hypothetical protein Tco_0616047 [Tanacetum coccineum]
MANRTLAKDGCRDLFNKGLTSDLPKEATKDPLEKSMDRAFPYIVRNLVTREGMDPKDAGGQIVVREFCQKHYQQLLPFMAERAHNAKLKDVRSQLSYSESTEQETEKMLRYRDPQGSKRKRKKRKVRKEHQALKDMKLDLHRRREVFTEDDGWDCASDL